MATLYVFYVYPFLTEDTWKKVKFMFPHVAANRLESCFGGKGVNGRTIWWQHPVAVNCMDSKVLVVSSKHSRSSKGGSDLYYSNKMQWSRIFCTGSLASLNTPDDDLSVYVAKGLLHSEFGLLARTGWIWYFQTEMEWIWLVKSWSHRFANNSSTDDLFINYPFRRSRIFLLPIVRIHNPNL